MESRKIKAVLFDFDGVICQTEVYRMDHRERQLAEAGIIVDRKALYTLINQPPDKDRRSHMDKLFGDQEVYWQHREELLLPLGLEYNYRELCTRGLPEILVVLKNTGLKTAVVSNSRGEILKRGMEECGLNDLIDIVISGWDLDHKKPAPFIYRMAMSKLGVMPEESVVVEDSQNGILAGRAAGAAVIFALRDRDGLLNQQGSDHILM